MIICELDSVLTEKQCKEIIHGSNLCKFQDMSLKYDAVNQRNNSRLLVLDPDLSRFLWKQIEVVLADVIRDYEISLYPLGFDVLRGSWELSGCNEALRINKYSSGRSEFFAPHKDAQHCPSGDERSFLSFVLYLNEGFKGGETCFYLPNNMELHTKGMTVDEEIEGCGGLENGFERVKVTPATGSAVLFSQHILHESTPLLPQVPPGAKLVLRTDILLQRKEKPVGFSVSIKEKDDYFKCLNYFREAQQQELNGKPNEAGQLYERALSVRYCYPAILGNVKFSKEFDSTVSAINLLPSVIWENIFVYLNGQDAERLIYAFPDLRSIKQLHELRFASEMKLLPDDKRPKFYPEVEYQHGIYTCFRFSDVDFFRANETGCCRVAAMYSFFLLGQNPSDKMYPVRFNPDTQEVCALPVESLLWSTFYNQPCYGAVYKVRQHGEIENPCKDFAASVDRDYMSIRHSAEFIGVDVEDTFRVKTTMLPASDSDEMQSSDYNSDEIDHYDYYNYQDSSEETNSYNDEASDNTRDYADNKNGLDDKCPDGAIDATTKMDILSEGRNKDESEDKDSNEGADATAKAGIMSDCREDDGDEKDDSAGEDFDKGAENIKNSATGSECRTEGTDSVSEAGGEGSDAIRKVDILREYRKNDNDEKDKLENKGFVEDTDTVNFMGYTVESDKFLRVVDKVGSFFSLKIEQYDSYRYNAIIAELNDLIMYDEDVEHYHINCTVPSVKEIYLRELLRRFKHRACVSTTVVSSIDESHDFTDHICFCHGHHGGRCSQFSRRCKSSFYNHLVFDFQESQLVVQENGEKGSACSTTCFLDSVLTDHVQWALRNKIMGRRHGHGDWDWEDPWQDEKPEIKHFTVKIEALADEFEPFNHAGCSCEFPRLRVDEYVNLKDYPYLNHIHLIVYEFDDEMYVWSVYCGIVAL